jgi:DNA repair proteins
MDVDGYHCDRYLLLREFSDIKTFPELATPKKRIQIVESRLERKTSILYERRNVRTPQEAAELARKLYTNYDKEYLYAIYLTSRMEPIAIELLSIGTLDAALVSSRDIVKTAILSAAVGCIILHNHPSGGEIVVSEEDIKVTKRLNEACKLMTVKLFDHIIVTEQYFVSLNERGIIN